MRAGAGLVQQDGRLRSALKVTMTRLYLQAVLAERTSLLEQNRLAQSRAVQLIGTTRHLVRAGQLSCERTRQVLAASERLAL